MKTVLLTFAILLSQQVFAGAPGHGGFFCESESGRTNVTVIDRYGDGVTIFLSIDNFSSIYEPQSAAACVDDCMWIDTRYSEDGVSYVANSGDTPVFQIDISGSKAVINSGFGDPRDYSIFRNDISLNCKAVEQQI